MYIVGQEEIDALTRVIQNKALFRYGIGSECDLFEERYAKVLGVKHFALAASGSDTLRNFGSYRPRNTGPRPDGFRRSSN